MTFNANSRLSDVSSGSNIVKPHETSAAFQLRDTWNAHLTNTKSFILDSDPSKHQNVRRYDWTPKKHT